MILLNPNDAITYYNRSATYYTKGDFDSAIEDCTKVIQLSPDSAQAYVIRAQLWLYIKKWEKAKSDFITAQDLGMDLIAELHNDYANVEDFEQETGIQLPEDIAALLTPPQA